MNNRMKEYRKHLDAGLCPLCSGQMDEVALLLERFSCSSCLSLNAKNHREHNHVRKSEDSAA